MKLLLLNREEELISIVSETTSDPFYDEVLNGEDTFEFEIADLDIEKGYRILFQDVNEEWREYIVTGVEEKHNRNGLRKKIYCESSFYELLGDWLGDIRPNNRSARFALEQALSTSRWEVGVVDDLGLNLTNFYRTDAKTAVEKVADVWGGEIKTRIEVIENKITGRFVDLYENRGTDKGKRFTYTKDIEEVTREISEELVITALHGFGKSVEIGDGFGRRLDFSSINEGRTYVENDTARLQYGRNNSDGTKAHVFGKVEFDDIEGKELLKAETKKALDILSTPSIFYKVKVKNLSVFGYEHEKVNLGDYVLIVDKEFVPELRFKARVVGIKRNLANELETEIFIGNALESYTAKSNSQNGAINDIRDKIGVLDKIANGSYQLPKAEGEGSLFFGQSNPSNPHNGDIWFKKNGEFTEMWQYMDGQWILIISTADLDIVKQEVEQAQETADQAKQDAIKAHDEAIAEADRLVKEQSTKFEADLTVQKTQITTEINTSRDQAISQAQAGITALETAHSGRMDGIKAEADEIKATADSTRAEVDLAIANAGFTSLDDTISSLDAITKSTKEDVNKATADAKLALENYEKIDKRNLYLESTEHEGMVIITDGLFEPNDFYNTSDYIRVHQGETYTFHDYSDALDIFRVATYDSYTSEFVERVGVPSKDGTFVTPNGISHIRVSISSQGVAKIERGETRSDYTQAPEDIQVSVTNIKGELVQKVSQDVFDVVKGTVETHDTSIAQNKNNILLKANQSYVDTIKGNVSANTASIGVNASQILLKASQSSLDGITGKVTGNTSSIEVNARAIQSKVSSVDVENILTGKQYVNQSQLTQTSSGIIASVTQLSSKVDTLETRNLYVNATESKGRVLNTTGSTDEISFYSTSAFIRVFSGETYTFHDYGGSLDFFRVSQYDLNTSTDFKRRVGVSVNNGKLVIPSDVTHIRVSKQAKSKVKIERSKVLSDWTPAPEDITTLDKYSSLEITVDGIQTKVGNKAEQSQVTQLANSINLKVSKGDVSSQINIEAGRTLISTGKLILDTDTYFIGTAFANDIKAKSLEVVNANIGDLRTKILTADVITSTHLKVDSAMITKLKVGNLLATSLSTDTIMTNSMKANTLTAITANITSIRSQVLVTDSVTSTHVKADNAMIDALFATTALIDRLTTKEAFITNIKAIDILADRVTAGTLNAANVNLINVNASNIVTGTLRGANMDLNLLTGRQTFTDSLTGNTLILHQGAIQFQRGNFNRYIEYQSEGITIYPAYTNTGTTLNTSIHLNGGVDYIQANNRMGTVNYGRLQWTSDSALLQIPNGAEFRLIDMDNKQAGMVVNYVRTLHSTGDTIEFKGNSIKTPRSGNRNIWLAPNGTGSVVAGEDGGSRYNIVASDFVKQSTRDSKTNILPFQSKGLDVINRLRPVSYNKIDKLSLGIREIELGFIAEDNLEVATPDGKGIYDSHITAYLVKGMQELCSIYTNQNSNIAKVTKIATNNELEIQKLQERIKKLEESVA